MALTWFWWEYPIHTYRSFCWLRTPNLPTLSSQVTLGRSDCLFLSKWLYPCYVFIPSFSFSLIQGQNTHSFLPGFTSDGFPHLLWIWHSHVSLHINSSAELLTRISSPELRAIIFSHLLHINLAWKTKPSGETAVGCVRLSSGASSTYIDSSHLHCHLRKHLTLREPVSFLQHSCLSVNPAQDGDTGARAGCPWALAWDPYSVGGTGLGTRGVWSTGVG